MADEDRRASVASPFRWLILRYGHRHGVISKREAGWKTGRRAAMRSLAYSVSKPWLSNFRVRLFSVTVRTS